MKASIKHSAKTTSMLISLAILLNESIVPLWHSFTYTNADLKDAGLVPAIDVAYSVEAKMLEACVLCVISALYHGFTVIMSSVHTSSEPQVVETSSNY